MYYRQQLYGKVSPPVARELITLATCADQLLKGKVANCVDVLLQRFKSIEATAGGTHWSVAQRMEVPLAEAAQVAQKGEIKNAQRDNYEESRTMWLASLPSTGMRFFFSNGLQSFQSPKNVTATFLAHAEN